VSTQSGGSLTPAAGLRRKPAMADRLLSHLGFAGVNERSACSRGEPPQWHQCTINKIPARDLRRLNKKALPLYTTWFSGWLDYPEYFFICAITARIRSSHHELQSEGARRHDRRAVTAAAAATRRPTKDVKGFVDLAYADMPRIRSTSPTSTSRCRERCRVSVLVPSSARLSRAGEGVSHEYQRH